MAINGAFTYPSPDATYQVIPLKTGGTYQFNALPDGSLKFISGTTFPYGIDISTSCNILGPTIIKASGGGIQLGADDDDYVYLYGDANDNEIVTYLENNLSDVRLKSKIQPIRNSLSKIRSLSGNTYIWNSEGSHINSKKMGTNDVGLIAQEVSQILPEAVGQRDGYLTINYHKIIPLLVEGMKDLADQLDIVKLELKMLRDSNGLS